MSKKKLLFAVNAENNPYDITNQLEFRIERDLDTNKVTMTLDGQEVSSEELHSLENVIAIPSDVMEVLKDGGVTANPETTGEEESLGSLKIGNDKFKVVTPTQVADYVDAAIAEAIASVYKFKGSVPTYDDLPDEDLTVGDVYNVEDTGKNYAWDGEAWDTLGGELIDEHIADKNNPHEVTKAQVGLGNVDNTSDAAKKTAFTGSIAAENAGFVTGGDAYTALGGKQETLVNGTNIKSVNGNSLLGSGNLVTEAYHTFPNSWTVNGYTTEFCRDVRSDESAVAGTAYLGTLYCDDLPAGLVQAEAVLEIISDGENGKCMNITISSLEVAPYKWTFSYGMVDNVYTSVGWNGVQPELVSGTNIKTLNNESLLGNGNIALTKSSVGLANVDNTSDASKKSNFTGSIASENTGFVVGGDVYTALGNKQATLVSGTNIKTVNGESVLGSGDVAVVSGVNDGTNWTSITIGSTTKAIPAGGGGGTTVVANPSGEPTVNLTKIQIGNVIYSISGTSAELDELLNEEF